MKSPFEFFAILYYVLCRFCRAGAIFSKPHQKTLFFNNFNILVFGQALLHPLPAVLRVSDRHNSIWLSTGVYILVDKAF
jgi:hypothetical protein